MSLVTSTQQEIIDEFISNYIKTNDNIGRQYLKLRQDALEIVTRINKEVDTDGRASDDSLLLLLQLEFTRDKVLEIYQRYLSTIDESLVNLVSTKSQYLDDLEQQFTNLQSAKDILNEDIDDIRRSKKPVVDKMNTLAERYSQGLTVSRQNKQKEGHIYVMTAKGSNRDPNSTFIDYESSVFEKTELQNLFGDINAKLSNLKTVDEIDESKDILPNSDAVGSKLMANDIETCLDELLRDSRAYSRTADNKFAYDITKSASVDVGGLNSVLDDYNENIEKLATEIQNLVAGGTAAKERWVINAKKLEMIQAVLADADDEDMDLDQNL